MDAAFTEAKHAIELDPLESRCHRILSTICLYRREYDIAEQHLRRAFDLNPNDADGLITKGRIAGLSWQARRSTGLAGSWWCASTQYTFAGTIFTSASPSIRFAALHEAAQAFKQMPSQTRGRARGSRPATPSLNGSAKRHG